MFGLNKALLTADISYDTITAIIELLEKNNIQYFLRRKIFEKPERRIISQRSSELPVPKPRKRLPNYYLYVLKKDLPAARNILNNLTFNS